MVRNVTGISVEDKADIGWYDVVGRLEYEAGSGQLTIISNVPCEIVVCCQELEVELLRGE